MNSFRTLVAEPLPDQQARPVPLFVCSSVRATTRIDLLMDDFLTKALAERRSLEQAVADLRAKYERQPSPDLARMIRELEAEISYRSRSRRNGKGRSSPEAAGRMHNRRKGQPDAED